MLKRAPENLHLSIFWGWVSQQCVNHSTTAGPKANRFLSLWARTPTSLPVNKTVQDVGMSPAPQFLTLLNR